MKFIYSLVVVMITLISTSAHAQFYDKVSGSSGQRKCIECEEGLITRDQLFDESYIVPCFCSSVSEISSFNVASLFIQQNYSEDLIAIFNKKLAISMKKNLESVFDRDFSSFDAGLDFMFKQGYAFKKTRNTVSYLVNHDYPQEYNKEGRKIDALKSNLGVSTLRYRELRDQGGSGVEKYGVLRAFHPETGALLKRFKDLTEGEALWMVNTGTSELTKIGVSKLNIGERIRTANSIKINGEDKKFNHPFYDFVTDKFKRHFYNKDYPPLRYEAMAAYLLGITKGVNVYNPERFPQPGQPDSNPYELYNPDWTNPVKTWINDNSPIKVGLDNPDQTLFNYAFHHHLRGSDIMDRNLGNRIFRARLKDYLESQNYSGKALAFDPINVTHGGWYKPDSGGGYKFSHVSKEPEFSIAFQHNKNNDWLNHYGTLFNAMYNNVTDSAILREEGKIIRTLFRDTEFPGFNHSQFSDEELGKYFDLAGNPNDYQNNYTYIITPNKVVERNILSDISRALFKGDMDKEMFLEYREIYLADPTLGEEKEEILLSLESFQKEYPWRPETGKVNGYDFLSYNGRKLIRPIGSNEQLNLYRLTNGDFLAVGDYRLSPGSVESATKYMYYSSETEQWHDFAVPDPTYEGDPLNFLFEGFWDGAKFAGRYVVPVEDLLIVIDGQDFDGQVASRYLAGGMLLVSVIPGGKLVEGASKIIKGTRFWGLAVKIGNKSVELIYTIKNGLVDFGVRGKLGQLVAKGIGEEAHHMIPWALRNDQVVQEAAYAGFHMNDPLINGRALKKFSKLTPDGNHANHPKYNDFITRELETFKEDFPGFSPEEAAKFLEFDLIPRLNKHIDDAIDSGMTLNEYFRLLL